MSITKEINREVGWSIALSALMIVAGALAVIVPQASGIAVTIVVSWLMVFCGVAHLAFAWHTRRRGASWWGLLIGVIYIAAGGYILLHPVAGLASLTLVLATYLLMAAILEFVLAFRLRPLPGSGWLLLDGILTMILGVMIGWTWPSDTIWVIGMLVGISMIFSGFTRLMLSLSARRVAHAFEADFHEPKQAV